MGFKHKKMVSAIWGVLLSSYSMASAADPETYSFLFSGDGATASGLFTTNESISLIDGGEGSFDSLVSLNVSVSGALSGNGDFTLSDFSHYIFETTPGADYSENLAGQDQLDDFNLFGNFPAPSGVSETLLAAGGGEGEEMLLSSLLCIAGPCGGPSISILDLENSLRSSSLGLQSTILETGTLINGAHSRPMSRRVPTGEKTFWVAGDWGTDNHNSHNGVVGLAEVGIGYNYGVAQVNASFGYSGTDQDLINNGDIEARGKFVMVEGIIPLPQVQGVYATLGVFGQWGDLDTRRGYDTGTIEHSSGSTDTKSWGVRARLDWENAFSYNSTNFSPYADLWHNDSHMDAYTETRGSLPASYDSQDDSVTDLRIGLNTLTHINNTKFDFIANIEAAHRFDSKASTTSGTVATLGTFSFDGQDYEQNWLKAGFGVEGKLGNGKISVMLNGSTEGEMPDTWLAASYQILF